MAALMLEEGQQCAAQLRGVRILRGESAEFVLNERARRLRVFEEQ